MTDNIKLPPLPEGYDKYDPPLLYDGQMFNERQMQDYAREAVRLNAGGPPEGYALISVEALRAWGKLDELRECCRYLKHATPQPAHVDDEALRDAAMANERTRRCVG